MTKNYNVVNQDSFRKSDSSVEMVTDITLEATVSPQDQPETPAVPPAPAPYKFNKVGFAFAVASNACFSLSRPI